MSYKPDLITGQDCVEDEMQIPLDKLTESMP